MKSPLCTPHPTPHRFSAANTQQLFESLTPAEQRAYNFDLCAWDWPTYITRVHVPGLLEHVVGQGSAQQAGAGAGAGAGAQAGKKGRGRDAQAGAEEGER